MSAEIGHLAYRLSCVRLYNDDSIAKILKRGHWLFAAFREPIFRNIEVFLPEGDYAPGSKRSDKLIHNIESLLHSQDAISKILFAVDQHVWIKSVPNWAEH